MGRARSEVNDTYAPYEVLLSTAAIYLALIYGLSWFFAWLEQHLNPTRTGRSADKTPATLSIRQEG
ncbi:hypothetical protein D3C76_1734390 [compost metagenome]